MTHKIQKSKAATLSHRSATLGHTHGIRFAD